MIELDPSVANPYLSIVSIIANRKQIGIATPVEIPRPDADSSTTGALSLVDVPPFLRTEGHLIEKLFVVVAAASLGPTLQGSCDRLNY